MLSSDGEMALCATRGLCGGGRWFVAVLFKIRACDFPSTSSLLGVCLGKMVFFAEHMLRL